MSEQVHDHSDVDSGAARIDQAWRSASRETPSPSLDAAILQAARGAATPSATSSSARPRSRAPRLSPGWSAWLAAAAVTGVAFTLVQTLHRPGEVRIRPTEAPPANGPVAVAPAPRAGAEAARPVPRAAPEPTEAPKRFGHPGDLDHHAESVSVAGRPPAPEAVPSEPATSAGLSATSAAAPVAASARAAPANADAAAKSGEVARARTAEPEPGTPADPLAWVRGIERLHAAGERAAAADLLREFRRSVANADAYLPETLRDWAASIH